MIAPRKAPCIGTQLAIIGITIVLLALGYIAVALRVEQCTAIAAVRAADCRSAFLTNLVDWHAAERDARDGHDNTVNLATAVGGLRTTLVLCFPPASDVDVGVRHPANLLVDLDNMTPLARLMEIDRLLEVGWERSTVGKPWQGDVP